MNTDTPETNEAWNAVSRTPNGRYDSHIPIKAHAYAMLDHSKKMEREKNAALSALAELYAALIRYEGDVDGEAPSTHHRMMDRAAALLPENAQRVAPPTRDSNEAQR